MIENKLFGKCWACGEDLELVQNIGTQRPARISFITKYNLNPRHIEDEGDSIGLGSAMLHCPNCQSERVFNQIFCPECARYGIQTPCKLTKHNSIVNGKTYINIQCENYLSNSDMNKGFVSDVRKCKFAINVLKGDGRTVAEEWKVINGMYGIISDWIGSIKRLIWYYTVINRNDKIKEFYEKMLKGE